MQIVALAFSYLRALWHNSQLYFASINVSDLIAVAQPYEVSVM